MPAFTYLIIGRTDEVVQFDTIAAADAAEAMTNVEHPIGATTSE